MSQQLPDVQAEPDQRGIALDHVGICALRWPIAVLDYAGGTQQTVAELDVSVNVGAASKGAHLSRFVEALEVHRHRLSLTQLPYLADELIDAQGADVARVRVRFPYFLWRTAPISGLGGLLDYDCTFTATGYRAMTMGQRVAQSTLAVRVPVTSVCPCSKEISDYGAHNQRGYVTITVNTGSEFVWIEELVAIAEASGSSPVYPILKRPDERAVTMAGYDKPVFVEDMVRECMLALQADTRVLWCKVHAENLESIHNHNAYAECEWARDD